MPTLVFGQLFGPFEFFNHQTKHHMFWCHIEQRDAGSDGEPEDHERLHDSRKHLQLERTGRSEEQEEQEEEQEEQQERTGRSEEQEEQQEEQEQQAQKQEQQEPSGSVSEELLSLSDSSSCSPPLAMAFTSSLLNASHSLYNCAQSTGSNVLFTMFTAGHVLLLLPLHALVLLLGLQRWRRRQPASHSDVFTYHMVAVEVLGVSGSLVYCLGIYTGAPRLLVLGMFVTSAILPGQAAFHILTCVERYLAVLHPVTYIHLRGRRGVRVRNLSVLSSWLLISGWIAVMWSYFPDFPFIPLLCLTSASLVVVSFCCLSVLCALIRPGPGDGGGDRKCVDQSKQRAFVILRAVMGAVLLRLGALLVSHSLPYSLLDGDTMCALIDASLFVTIPSSLVLPLLFLHKAGKLACCWGNTVNTEPN